MTTHSVAEGPVPRVPPPTSPASSSPGSGVVDEGARRQSKLLKEEHVRATMACPTFAAIEMHSRNAKMHHSDQ
ncbi:hypothetical protein [Streptomyces sp. 8N706]|uniref:hypothetical protein n=1 Tax=Streptomyces sp. 8N706 TaxID=3457416 RepID=UPI003FD15F5B